MKYSSWSKKIATVLVAALAIVGWVQPGIATADNQTFEDAPIEEGTYQDKNSNSLFGIADDFGVFVQGTAEFDAHSDTNVACNRLLLKNPYSPFTYDMNLTHRSSGDVSFINQAGSYIKIANADKIYLGTGNVKKVLRNGKIHGYQVDDKDILIENLKEVYKTKSTTSYINLDQEFDRLRILAGDLDGYASKAVKAEFKKRDDNYFTFKCNGEYSAVEITAAQMMDMRSEVKVEKLPENGFLLVNVDTQKAGNTITFNGTMSLNGNNQDFNPLASNIIWNFNDYSGTIVLRNGTKSGIILAPQANVKLLGANLNGIIIANNFTNKDAEAHYVPSNVKFPEQQPVIVYADSVDGGCCPGKPLDQVQFAVFNAETNQMIEGTQQSVIVGTLEQLNVPEAQKNRYYASWKINQPGKYYIQAVSSPDGFNQTPIKARFDVIMQDLKLVLKPVKGKESNGFSSAWVANNVVRIRHYTNEVYATALNVTTLEQLFNEDLTKSTRFDLYTSNSTYDDLTCIDYVGSFDRSVNKFNYISVPKPGFYCIKQTASVDGYMVDGTVKKIAVFVNPIGQYMTIELDQGDFSKKVLDTILSDTYVNSEYKITRLTKSLNNALLQLGYEHDANGELLKDSNGEYIITNDYDALTDNCIFFFNKKN